MINFKNISLNDIEKYIGKKIYIVHPGSGEDAYWGTIDSESPHLLCRIFEGIYVSELGIEVITGNNRYDSFDIKKYNIYLDEELARQDLNKIV